MYISARFLPKEAETVSGFPDTAQTSSTGMSYVERVCPFHRSPLAATRRAYKLDSTTTAHTNGGVGPVEKLSMSIMFSDVASILSWAFHILKRPASQSPLRSISIECLRQGTACLTISSAEQRRPRASNVRTRTRRYTCPQSQSTLQRDFNIPISLSQISCTLPGLPSLFLYGVKVTSQQTR